MIEFDLIKFKNLVTFDSEIQKYFEKAEATRIANLIAEPWFGQPELLAASGMDVGIVLLYEKSANEPENPNSRLMVCSFRLTTNKDNFRNTHEKISNFLNEKNIKLNRSMVKNLSGIDQMSYTSAPITVLFWEEE